MPHRQRAWLLRVGVILGCVLPVIASADEVEDAPTARVTARELRITRTDGVAHLTYTLRVRNAGRTPGELGATLTVPPGASITAARLRVGGKTTSGAILPDDAAAIRYDVLRSAGPARPAPALLVTWAAPHAQLSLAWLTPGQEVAIELEARAPLLRHDGAHRLFVPCEDDLVVRAGGQGRIEDHRDADSLPWSDDGESPPEASQHSCRVSWPSDVRQGVGVRWGKVTTLDAGTVVRVELEAGRVLEPTPRGAHVVFVVDASHSEGAEGIAAELALVRAVVGHVPDARVAVVAFSRRARAVTRGFVPARSLARALTAGASALAPEHGSDPIVGLRAAAALLAGKRGPTRIVVLTDRSFALGFRAADTLAAIDRAPSGTIAHIVERKADEIGGGVFSARLDQPDAPPADFGPLLTRTGGVLLSIQGGDREAPRGALAEAALELVRPVRIDELTVALLEVADPGAADHGPRELLREADALRTGASFTTMRYLDKLAPRVLLLRGRVWGRAWEMRVPVDAVLSRYMAALALGSGVEGLPESAARELGLGHGVLTYGTAFLASRPDAGPSTAGDDTRSGGTGLGTTCDCGSPGTFGFGSGTGTGHPVGALPDPVTVLAAALATSARACVARHGAPPSGAVLALEIRLPEVMAVAPRGVTGALAACLSEAAWALPPLASIVAHRQWDVPIARMLAAP